jgi:hypothetical protein
MKTVGWGELWTSLLQPLSDSTDSVSWRLASSGVVVVSSAYRIQLEGPLLLVPHHCGECIYL